MAAETALVQLILIKTGRSAIEENLPLQLHQCLFIFLMANVTTNKCRSFTYSLKLHSHEKIFSTYKSTA